MTLWKTLTIILITLSLSNSYASILLEQGQASPYRGLLFSESEAQNLKNQLVELDLQKDINKSLNKSIDLYKTEIISYQQINDIIRDQNKELANMITTSRSISDWQKIGYFVLGVVSTVVIVHAASQALK